ncbi:DNA repair protein RAD51 homolog 3 [Thrips palmi]|uniref:DNA repair protein RAD51 homolog 3 n=1 Tax=Thrips palmi TaxID=161013 RepID=A0A6P9A6G9_THRPL|nr:DNA repair protein RAD51 homolog 3 [Thrips palmi]
MFRPLSTVPLPATAQHCLKENGFVYCEDVLSHRGVNPEARNLLHQWNLHSNESWHSLTSIPTTQNSLDMWQEECTTPGIVTWSEQVDSMLGGGIPLHAITEFCGAPGSGKTQLCLQLCVDVQIPVGLGGLSGQAVFIDTASNFSPHRVREMADAYCIHCHQLLNSSMKNQSDISEDFCSDSVLKGIHCVSTHGITQLLAAIKLLPKTLEKNPKVRLIVIDNLAFPFNSGDSCSTIDRTSYVYRILSDMQKLALERSLAVVVTNQLTTRLIKMNSVKSELSPALGESMGHRVTQRLLLGRIPGNVIAAVLLKGNNQHCASAKFKITKEGIRDL